MTITLLVETDDAGKRYLDPDKLNELDKLLRDIVSGRCEYQYRVLMDGYVNRNTGQPFEFEDEPEALCCMTSDLLREDSALNGILSEVEEFQRMEDEEEKKASMLKYLLMKYVDCIFSDTEKQNEDAYVTYASYYHGYYNYMKYSLPVKLLEECGMKDSFAIDLALLPAEALIEYVIPYYYRDLGWADNENLRQNPKLMENLTLHWFEKARKGSLD